jgi:putative endopeptidase
MKLQAVLLIVFATFSLQDEIVEDVVKSMNFSVDPCQDFYHFSCGGWITNTKLPGDKSRYDRSFSIIEKHNQDILLSIVQSPTTNTKLTTFYASCMDTDTIEQLGYQPMEFLLKMVSVVPDATTLLYYTGLLHARGVPVLFGISTVIDSKNPKINIADFSQGGLALPYPDLYTDPSDSSVKIRRQYVEHISKMFQLVGVQPNDADKMGRDVLAFETIIAGFTVPNDQLVDPFVVYNKLDITGLQAISPNLSWKAYLSGLGYTFNQATVDVPSFFSNLSAVVPTTSQYWATYLRWQVINHYANRLSSAFVQEQFAFFGVILSGQKEMSPRWKKCIGNTDSSLGELLGSYFVKIAFPGESKQMALDILHGIEDAMKDDLTNIDWMDPTTRQRALTKLSLVTNMIGAPTNPKNYSNVPIHQKEYFNNMYRAEVAAIADQLSQIEKPSDKMAWGMTSPTVNAYYDPTRNQMVFPAGILQQPFFNVSFPTAMNGGGIGMVMGHELTHGFDNQGRDYDGNGVLVDWWLPETSAKFDSKVQCVINQYSKFEVLPNVYVNGKLTQGENIADMGGIKNSYHSFLKKMGSKAFEQSIVPSLTNAQLFFVAYAQGWCEIATPEYLKVQVETDPHSPAQFRVMGPLINLPQFSDLFQCPKGSTMNPAERCTVW